MRCKARGGVIASYGDAEQRSSAPAMASKIAWGPANKVPQPVAPQAARKAQALPARQRARNFGCPLKPGYLGRLAIIIPRAIEQSHIYGI
jgi:hypothetical protein